MIAAIGVFSLMDTCAKSLPQFYPAPGIVWARWHQFRDHPATGDNAAFPIWRSQRLVIYAPRAAGLGDAAVLHLALALPIARIRMLPLFVAALAHPILKEWLQTPRLIAILVGLAGALIIVRPGTAHHMVLVGMAFLRPSYQVLTRMVAGVDALDFAAPVGTVDDRSGLLGHALQPLALGPARRDCSPRSATCAWIRASHYAGPTLLAPFAHRAWATRSAGIVFEPFPTGWSLLGRRSVGVWPAPTGSG